MKAFNGAIRSGACAFLLAGFAAGCGASDPQSLIQQARSKLDHQEPASAAILLKSALQKDPQLVQARFLLGRAALAQSDFATAEAEFKRALELRHPADEVVPLLAQALLKQGAYDRVVKEIAPIRLALPAAQADVQGVIGNAQLRLGRKADAEASFAAALERVPDHVGAQLGRARMAAVEGRLAAAGETVDAVLARAPGVAEAWELKGLLHLASQRVDDAIAAWAHQLELDRDDVTARARLAALLIEHNRLKDAGEQLAVLKKQAPRLGQTIYLEALLAYRERHFEAARDAVARLERAAPDYVPGIMLAGLVDLEFKANESAQARFERILAHEPGHLAARRALVVAYLQANQAARAAAVIEPLLEARPEDSAVASLAGEVFLQSGNMQRAMRELGRAAKLKPGDAAIGTRVALSHFVQGRTDQGFAELEALSAGQPQDYRPDITLIAARLRSREFDKALAAVEALEKKLPNNSLPANLRGAALLGKGDVEGARRSFEAALKIRPDDFGAVLNLAQLDVANNNPQAAVERLDAVVKKDRKNVQAALALAELRGRLGASADEIAAILEQAIAAQPGEPAPRISLIALRLAARDTKRALAAANEAAAAIPGKPEILDVVARAHEAAGETGQAIAVLQKLAALQPKSATPWLRIAALQARAKDFDAARASLVRAHGIAPDSPVVAQQRVALALAMKDEKAALEIARKLQVESSTAAVGFALETDIHAGKQAWPQAVASARAGLKAAPAADMAVRLHAALVAGGQSAEAAKFAADWIKGHPDDVVMPLRLGDIAAARRDYREARRHYQVAVNADPANPVPLNNLAFVAGKLNEPGALDLAERAHRLAPQSGVIMETLASLLLERGQQARALELIQTAVRVDPQNAAIRLTLARALIAAGKKQEARRELDLLASLGERFGAQDEVAQLLKKL